MPTRSTESRELPYAIRRSALAVAVPLGGSESSRFDALVEQFPWRGVAFTVLMLAFWDLALLPLGGSRVEWVWMVALALGLGACVSEVVCRRDRLTRDGIERRSGLFGTRRVLVPYRDVELVEVEGRGHGSAFDVGTVVIRANGARLRLVGIVAPHVVAELIEQQRRAVKA